MTISKLGSGNFSPFHLRRKLSAYSLPKSKAGLYSRRRLENYEMILLQTLIENSYDHLKDLKKNLNEKE